MKCHKYLTLQVLKLWKCMDWNTHSSPAIKHNNVFKIS
jgi:hypothetical protein